MKRIYKIAMSLIICLCICTSVGVDTSLVQAGTKNEIVVQESKIQYIMKKDQKVYKDNEGRVRGITYFQYPQLKGSSSAIKKINKELKSESNKFFKTESSKAWKKYMLEALKENSFFDEKTKLYWTSSCKVTYNKNNIISMKITEDWWAGGALVQQFYHGFTFNTKTGKRLNVGDVIEGNAKEKILKAAKKMSANYDEYRKELVLEKVKATKKYKFYITSGKVIICYSWDGDRLNSFSVVGKYK